MSESAKTIIKFFCDRFLDMDYYPTSLKAVLDLSVDRLKHISTEEIKQFKEIEIKTIRDLTGLEIKNIKKISKKSGLSPFTLQNSIVASYLIANAWNKRKEYMKKQKMKVVTLGLDYAGKTSLINRLMSKESFNELIDTQPTIGANIEEYQTEKVNLVIWDLGGQKAHLEEYLSEPEKFFIQLDVMIFVIDTQDDKRYDDAINYLTDILKLLEFLEEFPYILVLLNKVDADLKDDPDFQIKLEYLTEKVFSSFFGRDKDWTFEIIPTSIYNFYSSEPEIAKNIKNIFAKDIEPKKDEFLVSIEEKLQTLLDINLNLLDRVVSEVAELKRLVARLSPSDISKSLFAIPFEKVPSDFISKKEWEDMKEEEKEQKSRRKEKKKKQKISSGPPRKLESLPTPKEKEGPIKTEGPSQEAQIEKPPSAPIPPGSAPPSVLNVENLRPPPPPPNVPPPAQTVPQDKRGGLASRLEVINELKEMFIKRGIVK